MNITETDKKVICLAIAVVGIGSYVQQKAVKRKCWERPHLGIKKRLVYGQQNLLQEMRISDIDSFVSIIRFRPESFDKLLSLVGPNITHYSNREPINPSTRLAVTLRYLATGESAKSLSYNYRLGISTVDKAIKETLGVISNVLKPIVLPEVTTEMWLNVAEGFHQRWNVPNCCGSLDGKQIRTKKPKHSGSEFYNYKGFFSTVMMAICDSKYKFLAADTGCQGRNNDVIVLNNSKIGEKLVNGTFNLPGKKEIMYGPTLPHFLLADEIFGIQPYLMVPYPGRGTGKLNYLQKTFNYRQSRGRRVIENTYGIFANVWGIFHTTINATPDTVDRIVMAAVCLHNFRILEKESIHEFIPKPKPDKTKQFPLESISESIFAEGSSSKQGKCIRDQLAEYFVYGGRVHWQDSLIY